MHHGDPGRGPSRGERVAARRASTGHRPHDNAGAAVPRRWRGVPSGRTAGTSRRGVAFGAHLQTGDGSVGTNCWHCRLTAVGSCRFCGRGRGDNHARTQPFVLTLDRRRDGVSRARRRGRALLRYLPATVRPGRATRARRLKTRAQELAGRGRPRGCRNAFMSSLRIAGHLVRPTKPWGEASDERLRRAKLP